MKRETNFSRYCCQNPDLAEKFQNVFRFLEGDSKSKETLTRRDYLVSVIQKIERYKHSRDAAGLPPGFPGLKDELMLKSEIAELLLFGSDSDRRHLRAALNRSKKPTKTTALDIYTKLFAIAYFDLFNHAADSGRGKRITKKTLKSSSVKRLKSSGKIIPITSPLKTCLSRIASPCPGYINFLDSAI